VAGVGHRKIAALMRADGHHAPEATVKRALKARGLLQPAGYQRERRDLARARKAAFVCPGHPPQPRLADGLQRVRDARRRHLAAGRRRRLRRQDRARVPAHGLQDLARGRRGDRSCARTHELLGHTLLEDCTCPHTGQITPIVIVTDNGPCYKAAGFAAYIARRPELTHVRTRHRSPETNGVIERWFGSLKYEQLYRHEITDGLDLTTHVEDYIELFNTIRPHEEPACQQPLDRYLTDPHPTAPTRQTVQEA
jgi:putative transposase